MNAMSVSPVKPPLNTANLTGSTTTTNITKSTPLPTNNSYSPLNFVPESKPAATIHSVAPTEKTGDLCSKPAQSAPTSNGTVSPIPNVIQSSVPAITAKCVEGTETAENLTTHSSPAKSENIMEIISKVKNSIEEKKEVKQKSNTGVIAKPVDVKALQAIGKIEKETAQTPIADGTTSNLVSNVPKKEEKRVEFTAEVSKGSVNKSPKIEPKSIATHEVKLISTTASLVETSKEKKLETETVAKIDAESVTPGMVLKKVVPKAAKRRAKGPVKSVTEEEGADGRKSKRTRLPTQPYQSPIPELQLIAKLNTPTKTTLKTSNEKIIAFYKNEFLAVRNPEGSFYICQAFQNIYRSSLKIKIRWFTNLPQNIYTPDFYDTTEFDCILTNVTMTRVEKDRWKLPDHEHTRIENILKRALDVEKGVMEQLSVTEEHPDGLDLSLYKDETQLQKRRKKPPSPKKAKTPVEKEVKTPKRASKAEKPAAATLSQSQGTKKSARVSSYLSQDTPEIKMNAVAAEKPLKKEKKDKKKKSKDFTKQKGSATVQAVASKLTEKVSSKSWEPLVKASNSSRVVLSLKKEDTSTKDVSSTSETKTPKRTSRVSKKAGAAVATSSPTHSPAKRRKEEPKWSLSHATTVASTERPGKVRNAGSAVAAKINSAAMRTMKERERKTAPSNQRRK